MNKACITLLLQLQDASKRLKQSVTVPLITFNIHLVVKLYNEGLIQGFNFVKNKVSKFGKIIIFLRYFFTKPIFKNIKIFSKPSRYFFFNYLDICNLYDKKFTLFFSTNKGILTSVECKKLKIGGIALFKC